MTLAAAYFAGAPSGRSGTGGSLRDRAETVIVPAGDPFDLAATKTR